MRGFKEFAHISYFGHFMSNIQFESTPPWRRHPSFKGWPKFRNRKQNFTPKKKRK